MRHGHRHDTCHLIEYQWLYEIVGLFDHESLLADTPLITFANSLDSDQAEILIRFQTA